MSRFGGWYNCTEARGLLAELIANDRLRLLFLLGVLALMVAVASYVIRKIRAKSVQHELTASELLSKFRESRRRGELTDAEFRTIKTALAERLQEELKDDGETG